MITMIFMIINYNNYYCLKLGVFVDVLIFILWYCWSTEIFAKIWIKICSTYT